MPSSSCRVRALPAKGHDRRRQRADIVAFDPEQEHRITAETHHSKIGYNVYEGTRLRVVPELVMGRGTVVVDGTELVAKSGHGQFIKRAPVGESLPSASARS